MWITNKPIIALAPMADMTDNPFCCVCREVSGKNFVIFREMASAEAIARDNEKTLKMCAFREIERPIVLQIFGIEPQSTAAAAKILVDKFKPDGIDINMGCPVPKIAGKNRAGAALMKDCDRAVAIIQAIKKEKLGVPLSVKTRLGWSKEEEILEFAPKLEQAGADLLTIHGRTKIQGYSGQANWQMIAEVKKSVSIPVIANGDVASVEDMTSCLKITGADGVMIGRGALGNPWIFRGLVIPSESRLSRDGEESFQRQQKAYLAKELVAVVLRHAKLHVEHYGEKSIVTFRKHLAWYFKGERVSGTANIKKLRNELMKVSSLRELEDLLAKLII